MFDSIRNSNDNNNNKIYVDNSIQDENSLSNIDIIDRKYCYKEMNDIGVCYDKNKDDDNTSASTSKLKTDRGTVPVTKMEEKKNNINRMAHFIKIIESHVGPSILLVFVILRLLIVLKTLRATPNSKNNFIIPPREYFFYRRPAQMDEDYYNYNYHVNSDSDEEIPEWIDGENDNHSNTINHTKEEEKAAFLAANNFFNTDNMSTEEIKIIYNAMLDDMWETKKSNLLLLPNNDIIVGGNAGGSINRHVRKRRRLGERVEGSRLGKRYQEKKSLNPSPSSSSSIKENIELTDSSKKVNEDVNTLFNQTIKDNRDSSADLRLAAIKGKFEAPSSIRLSGNPSSPSVSKDPFEVWPMDKGKGGQLIAGQLTTPTPTPTPAPISTPTQSETPSSIRLTSNPSSSPVYKDPFKVWPIDKGKGEQLITSKPTPTSTLILTPTPTQSETPSSTSLNESPSSSPVSKDPFKVWPIDKGKDGQSTTPILASTPTQSEAHSFIRLTDNPSSSPIYKDPFKVWPVDKGKGEQLITLTPTLISTPTPTRTQSETPSSIRLTSNPSSSPVYKDPFKVWPIDKGKGGQSITLTPTPTSTLISTPKITQNETPSSIRLNESPSSSPVSTDPFKVWPIDKGKDGQLISSTSTPSSTLTSTPTSTSTSILTSTKETIINKNERTSNKQKYLRSSSNMTLANNTFGNEKSLRISKRNCPDPSSNLLIKCPDPMINEYCDIYNPLQNFTKCFNICKPAFCCIHDSKSLTMSPSCSKEPNCRAYSPCYVIWWRLHDTVGPATFFRNGGTGFVDMQYISYQLKSNETFVKFNNQLFGHHFGSWIDAFDNMYGQEKLFTDNRTAWVQHPPDC